MSKTVENTSLPKSNSKMFDIGVGQTSSPNGMPIRGSRDSGLDFDVLYRETVSEVDSVDDYISRDFHTDYSGHSPSVAETLDDSISMPKKGVPNHFSEDCRSSDQTTVIEEDKPENEPWWVIV